MVFLTNRFQPGNFKDVGQFADADEGENELPAVHEADLAGAYGSQPWLLDQYSSQAGLFAPANINEYHSGLWPGRMQ